jgi:hypothetical protein
MACSQSNEAGIAPPRRWCSLTDRLLASRVSNDAMELAARSIVPLLLSATITGTDSRLLDLGDRSVQQ